MSVIGDGTHMHSDRERYLIMKPKGPASVGLCDLNDSNVRTPWRRRFAIQAL